MRKKPTKNNQKCLICGSAAEKLFSKKILDKFTIDYFRCSNCHFIQTEKPFWLDEAYESPINIEDTGILQRNIVLAIRSVPFLLTLSHKAQLLDFAGGYGIFTRLLRDLGFDAFWSDTYCQNLMARGFEAKKNQQFSALTAFEVFEHLEDPIKEIQSMKEHADIIIFSTQLSDQVATGILADWWYMGYSHGQHIAIFSYASLKHLADNNSLHLWSDKHNFHVLSKSPLTWIQKLSLSKLSIVSFPLVFLLRKSKTMSDHILNKR